MREDRQEEETNQNRITISASETTIASTDVQPRQMRAVSSQRPVVINWLSLCAPLTTVQPGAKQKRERSNSIRYFKWDPYIFF